MGGVWLDGTEFITLLTFLHSLARSLTASRSHSFFFLLVCFEVESSLLSFPWLCPPSFSSSHSLPIVTHGCLLLFYLSRFSYLDFFHTCLLLFYLPFSPSRSRPAVMELSYTNQVLYIVTVRWLAVTKTTVVFNNKASYTCIHAVKSHIFSPLKPILRNSFLFLINITWTLCYFHKIFCNLGFLITTINESGLFST